MIILSCGHEVEDMGHAYTIYVKSCTREGENAVKYLTVCGPCEDGYRQAGIIFDTNEKSMEWLKEGI